MAAKLGLFIRLLRFCFLSVPASSRNYKPVPRSDLHFQNISEKALGNAFEINENPMENEAYFGDLKVVSIISALKFKVYRVNVPTRHKSTN